MTKANRKHLINIILLFFIVFLYSCTIKVSDSDKDDGNGSQSIINLYDPYPVDGDTGISLTPQLSWNWNGSNINNLRFEVYLDTIMPPNILLGQVYSPFYYMYNPLDSNKTYYWRIKALYNENGETYSSTWKFTTISGGR